MELRSNAKYAMLVPTSMGVRLTPLHGQPVHASDTFIMHVTSAETNVASISSYLGLPVKVLTAFVQGSPIAQLIKSNLRSRGMDFEGPEIPQGGPWGYRHQFNIADSGFGVRAPRVHNDRAGEVGRTLKVEDFDVERIFNQDGAEMMHISGLFAALSPETGQLCLKLSEYARASGTRISFDLNHRASFWKNREAELLEIFTAIAERSDVLIGNEEDYQLALGLHGPEAGGKDIDAKIHGFKEMIHIAQKRFPNAQVFANTLREVESANEHLWGALLLSKDGWHYAEPRSIQILDRIGGGDGFVGGLLYGLIKGWESEKCLQFAWATGAMATTMLEDYATPQNEDQVWSVWEGNARVVR